MKILLLGKTGLLGSEFHKILEKKSREISSFRYLAPHRANFDVLDFEQVDDVLSDNCFDMIIYCVAYTDVDNAENKQETCHALNVEALENLIKYNIPIIHFSTDYVFSAQKGDEIGENFKRNPINFYGKTKLAAEQLLENFAKKWWNIRTSWLFGKGGKSFISSILEKSRDNQTLEIVDDEYGRPTYSKDLADYVVAEFIEKEQPSGHYHIQNTGEPVSWKNFAEFFLRNNGIKTPVKAISSQKLKRSAQRPINSVLKNTKLPNELRDWQKAVTDFLS